MIKILKIKYLSHDSTIVFHFLLQMLTASLDNISSSVVIGSLIIHVSLDLSLQPGDGGEQTFLHGEHNSVTSQTLRYLSFCISQMDI